MKSEERHELKRNDLADGLSDLPGLWARHGNKILLLLAAAALVYFAVNYRRSQSAAQALNTKQALANAWAGVTEVSRSADMPGSAEFEKIRSTLETEVNQNVQAVIDDSSATPSQVAWAWLARGELYWSVSRVAASPTSASTTAPSSQPATKPAVDPLGLAANAYRTVIKDFAAIAEPAKLAHFGLAAVNEEKGDFAAARAEYKAVIEGANVAAIDKSMATARLAKLDSIEKPTLLLPATQPVVEKPVIDPLAGLNSQFNALTMGVGPMPTTAPASRPAATQPAATQPAASQPAR